MCAHVVRTNGSLKFECRCEWQQAPGIRHQLMCDIIKLNGSLSFQTLHFKWFFWNNRNTEGVGGIRGPKELPTAISYFMIWCCTNWWNKQWFQTIAFCIRHFIRTFNDSCLYETIRNVWIDCCDICSTNFIPQKSNWFNC